MSIRRLCVCFHNEKKFDSLQIMGGKKGKEGEDILELPYYDVVITFYPEYFVFALDHPKI